MINSLIEVFRMIELSPEIRVKILIQLGETINRQMGMNITEGIVYELVKILDPDNIQVENAHYKQFIIAPKQTDL